MGLALTFGEPVLAQQSDAPAGSPAATRAVDGLQLPAPDMPFGGKIERNAMQSTPFWQPRIAPPDGAPNVLLIMTDDVGFGAPSTFGGVIPTPALDRIAAMGLRYTNMHSTALCSPTRAALLTGRNHHSAGFGVIAEQATGFPGYDSVITKDKATVATILKDNGYNTSWFGKNHNTPGYQISMAGPFDQWPTGMGFDYFYGFMGGDTSQWTPGNLFRDTTQIYPFETETGFNLITAMADEAIGYMEQLDTLAPDQPWLVYYAPGGTHAPHHPTPEWIEKIEDMHLFDEGWNKLRDTIFANQKRLGVIPQTAELTPWPSDLLKNWDQLTADEKKLFIRQADVYARLSRLHRQRDRPGDPGRSRTCGDLDNTLIIYISGDNGSSAEGTLQGTPNEVAMFNGVEVPVEVQLKDFYDIWGSEFTYNHMAVPWTWAFDTPFKWTKQIAIVLRRHQAGHGDRLAEGHHRQGRRPQPVRPCHRHRADHPRGRRHPRALGRGRHRPEPDGGDEPRLYLRRGQRGRTLASPHPVFRDVRQLRDLSRGLDAGGQGDAPVLGHRRRRRTPTRPTPDWELYDITTDWTQNNDVAAAEPREGQGARGDLVAGGQEVPGAAA